MHAIVWLEPDRLREVGDGAKKFALIEPGFRAIAKGGEEIGIETNRLAVIGDRTLDVLLDMPGDATQVIEVGILESELDCGIEVGEGVVGFAYFFQGDYPSAIADLQRVIERDPHHFQSSTHVIFRFLARVRSGQDGRPELETHSSRQFGSDRLYDLYLGKGPAEAALKASRDRCEAEFHVGAWYLISGNRDAARRHLQAASDAECRQSHPHHRAAAVELKRMGK